MKLCWTVQLVHQIFTRLSAISTCFYYLVFIHRSSSIKCKSPWGYLLLGTKNYWKIPSIIYPNWARADREYAVWPNIVWLSVRTPHVFSSKVTSFTSNTEKIPRQVFFFSLNAVTSLFTTIHTASPKLLCQSISPDLLVFIVADNSYRTKETLSEGSFQQVCIHPLLELDYMFFHARKLKVKQKLSLACLRERAKSNHFCEICQCFFTEKLGQVCFCANSARLSPQTTQFCLAHLKFH